MQLAGIFGKGMVLQRDKKITVWGTGTAGEMISVEIQAQKSCCEVAVDGTWTVQFDALHASDAETMTVESDRSEPIVIEDVLVGDVWIAAGQSNMEFFMRYDKNRDTEFPKCTNAKIRFYDVPRIQTEKIGRERDYSDFGFWRSCDPENIQYFSAVGYYFAKEINRATDVPVGILGCNCGGTRACCWMDEKTIQECGSVWMREYEDGLNAAEDLEKEEQQFLKNPMMDKSKPFANEIGDRLMYGVSKEELFAFLGKMSEFGSMVIGPWHEWRPAGLYYTMLEKIIPYAVKGVIYYQGESDETHPEIYSEMMGGLIRLWRARWNDELPFIMTQLAPFSAGEAYPVLREQQAQVAEEVPDVWLASIGDVGNEYDIHPKEKAPVGKRLALLALGHVYHKELLCDAPVLKDCVRTSADSVTIRFANAGTGMVLSGECVNAMKVIENSTGREMEFEAEIGSDCVSIRHESTESTIKIEFAKTPFYEINLYNSAHIPVMPFEIKAV